MTPVQFEHPEWLLPFRRAPALDRDILGTPGGRACRFLAEDGVEISNDNRKQQLRVFFIF